MTGRWPPTAARLASFVARVKTVPLVLLALVAVGAIALFTDLDGKWRLLAPLPLLLFMVLRCISGPRLVRVAAFLLGLVVIPVLALLGVDWIWAQLTEWRPDPWGSLFLGAVLIGLATWVYLRPWWTRCTPSRPLVWTIVWAMLLVLAPPFVVWLLALGEGDERTLDRKAAVVSRLDVIALSEQNATPAEPTLPLGWSVRTWRGQITEGDRVRWDAGEQPPLVPRDDVDRVLLLMVDGGPERLDAAPAQPQPPEAGAEIDRWLGLADRVSSRFTPTFVLLRTADDARLRAWNKALSGRSPGSRRGRAVTPEEAARGRTTTELALKLAAHTPTSDQDLALAATHRPALLFDSDEPYPTPLNIERLLASGEMKLCEKGQALGSVCSAVDESADLHNRASHLAYEPDELAEIRDESTIYVNVTRSGNERPNKIYLDYWWYFPLNPAGAGGGAFCGAGFVIAGITCFDHQGDWEGVTVVLDADSPSGSPAAVSYAQHNRVVRYSWEALQSMWDKERERFRQGIDTKLRPLVFVARGSHASYPTSCSADKCSIKLPGAPAHLKENRHDGDNRWPDGTQACPSFCLSALPVRSTGQGPALWNAFDGGWGTSKCVLVVVCTKDDPPRSPSFQDRYRSPWCATTAVDLRNGRLVRGERPKCTGRLSSDSELTGNERLVALGDSFSSGQGAGSYDRDTNGDGNTCYRSPRAWPQVLAQQLGFAALPSLACSGAVIDEVTTGRKHEEAERRRSQIGRIERDPGVVTITIGGNDAGFADVLKKCLFGNCVAEYQTEDGDVLEGKIAEVGGRLPDLYRAIKAAAPRASVIVVGYPRLFPNREDWPSAGGCLMRRLISGDEVDYLNELTPKLNATIAGAAKVAGVEFVDVSDAFKGRELLCKGETFRDTDLQPLQNQVRLVPASFHPNAAGHARLASKVATEVLERLSAP
jgi:lysophospholipase L1-like esterase